jgi:hypothetical protein
MLVKCIQLYSKLYHKHINYCFLCSMRYTCIYIYNIDIAQLLNIHKVVK